MLQSVELVSAGRPFERGAVHMRVLDTTDGAPTWSRALIVCSIGGDPIRSASRPDARGRSLCR